MDDKKEQRILVISIDGATFTLIRPWAEKGYLPNLEKLLKEGISGNLESTIPPITGPAWSSFQTGKNPGQHGIFDWLRRKKDGYKLEPINSNSIKHKTLWEIIGFQNRKAGVINVPVTYPPKPVNGFLVSGMLTPSKESDFTYPSELKKEKEFVDYEINPRMRFDPNRVKRWIKGLKNMVIKRKKLALLLMEKFEWDFFMVHFTATDLVQHRMWHTLVNESNPILEIYKEVDKAIGEIIGGVSENVCIFVISDHGFGPLYQNIYLNNWLMKEGYLNLKRDFITRVKKVMYKFNITPKNIYNLLGKIGLLGRGLTLGKGQRYNLVSRFFLSADNIDWDNTKAYSYGNIGQIYINTKGREPSGCVEEQDKDKLIDEIIAKLRRTRNPETGDFLFEKIYKKEEIYSGQNINNAPDILVLPKNMESMAIGVSEFVSNKIVEPSFTFTGGHRLEGIFIAKGKGIKSGSWIDNARIIDLAPTILYCMGLAIPEDMDGKVINSIFTEDFLRENKMNYMATKETDKKIDNREGFTEAEEDKIKKRLKDLGYVS